MNMKFLRSLIKSVNNKIMIGLFLLFPLKLFNQTNTKVLILLPESTKITWNKQIDRILKYNKVSKDSAITNLNELWRKVTCKRVQLVIQTEKSTLFSREDSLYQRPIYNRMTHAKTKPSIHTEGMENYYLSRKLSKQSNEKLKALFHDYNYNYILSINSFEMISKSFWNRNTYLNIHIDLYNAELVEIYGGKGNIKMKFTKRIYYDSCLYMIKNNCDFFIQSLFSQT